ncbi:M23 family metallopeptidase [Planktothrix agardhii 1033]|nr:M23 family metallopeptidase [Planktothrix agardhii 1033]
MFEVNPNPQSANAITSLAETNTFLAEQVMPKVYQQLQLFASDPTFVEQLKLPFGDTWDIQKAQTLATEWLTGNFSTLTPIKIVTSADIKGSSGAFADTTNQIYLAEDILTGSNVNQAVSVVLEEIGHSIDSRLNSSDSLGDEGEIFANIVQGKVLSSEQIQALKTDDDAAVVTIDGQQIAIEKADFDFNNRWFVQGYDWSSGTTNYVTEYDFGSNTRTDGKKGFAGYWGSDSVDYRLPSDKFLLEFWTQADFQQGQTYNFNVKSDDGYVLAALPVGATSGDDWEFISEWKWNKDAYGGKTLQFTPEKNGEYWVFAYYYEEAIDAYFDISWEKGSQALGSVGISWEKDGNTNQNGTNFKMPLPGGQNWYASQGLDGLSHVSSKRTAIDFDDRTTNGQKYNVPVLASASGQVIYKGFQDRGFGNHLVIDHDYPYDGSGYLTIYAHLKDPALSNIGASVNQGDQLGILGNTGNSYGSHLHFEIIYNNSKPASLNTITNSGYRGTPISTPEIKNFRLEGLPITNYDWPNAYNSSNREVAW